ncbi:hypothetical protein BaRGS_00007557 [Batillaria attramentaria]|uniref:Uncharacterized protein n=1 Tax=Batillaria attramentaria TaxID=370345 RepID=A0ABD0LPS6_9CAEN
MKLYSNGSERGRPNRLTMAAIGSKLWLWLLSLLETINDAFWAIELHPPDPPDRFVEEEDDDWPGSERGRPNRLTMAAIGSKLWLWLLSLLETINDAFWAIELHPPDPPDRFVEEEDDDWP